jgi:hypothetical protein
VDLDATGDAATQRPVSQHQRCGRRRRLLTWSTTTVMAADGATPVAGWTPTATACQTQRQLPRRRQPAGGHHGMAWATLAMPRRLAISRAGLLSTCARWYWLQLPLRPHSYRL